MARTVATRKTVDLEGLLEFVGPRHQWVMATTRADGRPQISPVTGGVDDGRRLVVSTYPSRDKVHNIRRNPEVSVCVLSDHFGGAWVQVDGWATIVDLPEALDGLVEYYRSVAGEHPDWDDYRQAMQHQGKCLIVIEPERWSPVATGGFPAPVVKLLDDLDQDDDGPEENDPGADAETGTVTGETRTGTGIDTTPQSGFDIAGFGD